jgi:hypothetical protein
MVFFAGAVAGGVIGLVAGALLQRRGGPGLLAGRGFATAVAVAALVVAAVALARSDHSSNRGTATPGTAAPATIATTTTAAAATTTTTAAGSPSTGSQSGGPITVPQVQTLSRTDAVGMLERLGLKVSIETLPLSNVPAGFVLSQSPLAGATVPKGTLVTLEVSAPA